MPPGSGFVFENQVGDGAVPKEYVPGVEKGLRGAAENGVIAGFPLIDFKAELFDGAYHEVDSSVLAFEIAARAAFKDGVVKAAPRILEPIMRVEVVTPDDYMGDVIGDLNSRRGQVTGMDSRDDARVIEAMVPLANMFGYVNTLRSMSKGRAQCTMHFDHYQQVPPGSLGEGRDPFVSISRSRPVGPGFRREAVVAVTTPLSPAFFQPRDAPSRRARRRAAAARRRDAGR
jgi:elongation factor G